MGPVAESLAERMPWSMGMQDSCTVNTSRGRQRNFEGLLKESMRLRTEFPEGKVQFVEIFGKKRPVLSCLGVDGSRSRNRKPGRGRIFRRMLRHRRGVHDEH